MTHWIKPQFSLNGTEDFTFCLSFFEKRLENLLPTQWLQKLRFSSAQDTSERIHTLDQLLPLIHWEKKNNTLHTTLLASALFTEGAGRYFVDSLSRWLNPGQFVKVLAVQSLDFHFCASDEHPFFMSHAILEIANREELTAIKNNLPSVLEEIKLCILAVKRTRQRLSSQSLSQSEQKYILQENINSLINRPQKDFDINLYDHMDHLLLKLTATEKTEQLQKQLTKKITHTPSVHNRDLYNEIQYFALLFRDKFAGSQDLKLLSRIISLQYQFHKALQQQIENDPHACHVNLKLFKSGKKGLALLLGINKRRQNELFSKRHILLAINQCLPASQIVEVENSFISDFRFQDVIGLYYLEIRKENHTPFLHEEIKSLKQHLSEEIKNSFEPTLHPLFMPRNDEEILRSIVLLCQQLKYPNSIPQCVISFLNQTQEELFFTISIARIAKGPSLKDLSLKGESPLKFEDWDIKSAGVLRKRWVKEANIFTVILSKSHFLRKDFKVDLFQARHFVANELKRLFGPFRDYNGGILAKQYEIFLELRNVCHVVDPFEEALLESFFFGLTPPLMRSILPIELLRSFFQLILDAANNSDDIHSFCDQDHFLLAITKNPTTSQSTKIPSLIQELQIEPLDLTSCSFIFKNHHFIGFAYRSDDKMKRNAFRKAVACLKF